MRNARLWSAIGMGLLVMAACAPAATATPPAMPTKVATSIPTRISPTPTPTLAPVGGTTATPQPTQAPTKLSESVPKYGGVLKAILTEDVETWDPFRQTGIASGDVQGLWHERLIGLNEGPPGCQLTPFQPALATNWKWLDDVTLQLKLREGVKFPSSAPMNGREMTAQDVVYSVQRQWPDVPKIAAPMKDQLKEVQAVDKYTVNLSLTRAYSPFVERVPAFKQAYIVGEEMYGQRKQVNRPEDHVGLGAFMFAEYRPGVRINIKKNPAYYVEGRPYLDGVAFNIIPDLSTAAAALRAGKVDIFWFQGGLPLIDDLKRTTQLPNKTCSHLASQVVYMKNDKPPFNDIRVRRALSMAIDREGLLKTVFLGVGVWQYSSVSPQFADLMLKLEDFPPEVQRYLRYEPEEAKKLLAEAGYAGGLSITVTSPPNNQNSLQTTLAEALAAQFAKVGIRPSLKVLEAGQWTVNIYQQRKYDDTAVGFGTSGEAVDTELYDMFHSKSTVRNRAFIADPAMDDIIAQSWTVTDPSKYKQIARQHQIKAAEQMYMIYLPHGPISAFWQPYLKNVNFAGVTSGVQGYLKHAWLEK